MTKYHLFLTVNILLLLLTSCNQKITKKVTDTITKSVDKTLFFTDDKNITIETVDCTLSDGTKTKCYQITTKSVPTDHEMGPWCPQTISDGSEKSGHWFKDGKIYNADGTFFKDVATLYNDEKWKMYDDEGNILRTKTKDDCLKLASAQLLDEYTNFCIYLFIL